MSQIIDLQKDIAASLYMSPGTFESLMERDFLKTKSEYGIGMMLQMMEKKRWIYTKGDLYYTYKAFAIGPEMGEYELNGIGEKFKRKTADEVVKDWYKNPKT